MDEPELEKGPEKPLFFQPPPGYWRTKLKLNRMVRLRDLIIHKERWSGDIDLAPPLSNLFPGEKVDPMQYQTLQRIEQEIRQTRRMVWWDLHAVGVPTGVTYGKRIKDELEEDEDHYDVIIDYFRLPRRGDGHAAYEAVIDVLEQGIGLWKGRLRQSKFELFNPIIWSAKAIRLPITVMERAGFGANEKSQELLLGGYGK